MTENLSRFKVKFTVQEVGEAEGELNRIYAPRTVEALRDALPISSRANVWQEKEVYFNVGIKKGLEKATKDIEKATIAYWPIGDALCVFRDKIEPYSEVNIVGKVTKNLEMFSRVKRGYLIRVELV
ncbi:MAG: cyclophilin-like fold protein [Candidatus Jordarchaeum sp.]|uniref:cyclophilin-like fold protein n=1 Tax=Candidatus Jordarchaeum sp. TaxID=2823881 RepID=UPI00404B28AD